MTSKVLMASKAAFEDTGNAYVTLGSRGAFLAGGTWLEEKGGG